ncbi:hypothetical protein [Ralstonia mannitolilytica]|uniref:hypothetical protein n=1 Tax=Ralstonia mannitolilytica TaxID=105219 RepID=UPI000E0F4B5D|nr:hypothetical protein [Ralstonia mannitolilytica]
MPPDMAQALCRLGRRREAQPAGIEARDGFAQSLVNLAWNTSRLQGISEDRSLDMREQLCRF